jgi:Integrase core domain
MYGWSALPVPLFEIDRELVLQPDAIGLRPTRIVWRGLRVRRWIGVQLAFIRPGKPIENAYIESFNGRFRDEWLKEHWFFTIDHTRIVIEAWRKEYNEQRPHSSLNYLTPTQFATQASEKSMLENVVSLTSKSMTNSC